MILGQTLFSFLKEEKHGVRIKEVRFMNRNPNGEVSGSTRLLYDEESETVQRYVNGSAPIASLSDEMVCFLAEVSRCFGRLTGDLSWEEDVWLCVDTEVIPEKREQECPSGMTDGEESAAAIVPMLFPPTTGEQLGCYRAGH